MQGHKVLLTARFHDQDIFQRLRRILARCSKQPAPGLELLRAQRTLLPLEEIQVGPQDVAGLLDSIQRALNLKCRSHCSEFPALVVPIKMFKMERRLSSSKACFTLRSVDLLKDSIAAFSRLSVLPD